MTDSPDRPEPVIPGGSQARVEIYTTQHCGYCVRAKRLLQDKRVVFAEYEVDGDEQARRRMMERAGGRRTLPQIIINDRSIGGFMDLYQLERTGQLDVLLAGGDP